MMRSMPQLHLPPIAVAKLGKTEQGQVVARLVTGVRRGIRGCEAVVGERVDPAALEHLRRTAANRRRFLANLRRAEAWYAALSIYVLGPEQGLNLSLALRLARLRRLEAHLIDAATAPAGSYVV
jgi:hypothetical protein